MGGFCYQTGELSRVLLTFAQNKEEAQWELDQCVPLKIKEGQIDKDTKQLQARKQRWWYHGTYMVAAAAFQWSFQQ